MNGAAFETGLSEFRRHIFSSKIDYRDLPELSPTQGRRLNQPSLQSGSKVEPKSNRIEFGSAHEWSAVWNGPYFPLFLVFVFHFTG